MDHPDPFLTWTVQTSGLTAGKARTVKSAVTIVQRCLDQWQEFLSAATSHPLHITVTATGHGDGAPTVTSHLDTLQVQVPHGVLNQPPGQLAAQILDLVVPALLTVAEQHPHPQPATFWQAPDDTEPLPDDPQPGPRIEELTEGEVMVIGRLDGTPDDADTRFRKLEDYLYERLEGPGVAGLDGYDETDSAAFWTLELLDGGPG
jgi:hypothetical protein